jgi:oligopeptide transport system ATP-binding protein
MNEQPLLQVNHLVKHFPIKAGVLIDREVATVKAVDDVSLTVRQGETLGLVGESGCGKSTLCRTLLRLIEPTAGSIHFDGREISEISQRELRPLRREMQMIFQDPFASLNPRRRVGQIVGDPMQLHGIVRSISCSSGSGSAPSTTTAFRTSSRGDSGSGSGSRERSACGRS